MMTGMRKSYILTECEREAVTRPLLHPHPSHDLEHHSSCGKMPRDAIASAVNSVVKHPAWLLSFQLTLPIELSNDPKSDAVEPV